MTNSKDPIWFHKCGTATVMYIDGSVVVRAAARQSTVICHREFLSQRKRILSYIPQLPFIVDKFADSTKKAQGMMAEVIKNAYRH